MNNSGKRLGNLLSHFLSVSFVLMEWNMCFPFHSIANCHYLLLACFPLSFLFLFPKNCILHSFLPALFLVHLLFCFYMFHLIILIHFSPLWASEAICNILKSRHVDSPYWWLSCLRLNWIPHNLLWIWSIFFPWVGPLFLMGLHNFAGFLLFPFP